MSWKMKTVIVNRIIMRTIADVRVHPRFAVMRVADVVVLRMMNCCIAAIAAMFLTSLTD